MAQETAANMTAPDGAIWQAWLDAFIHPKYETYARWYLRMNARWRRISLVVSLMLLLTLIFVGVASDAVKEINSIQALTISRFLSYLGSPPGLAQLITWSAGAVTAIFGIPAAVAFFARRSLGLYHIRLYIAYCTWMQTLPVTCVLVLLGMTSSFILGFFDTASFMYLGAFFVFVWLPISMAWRCASDGLSAATLRGYVLMRIAVMALFILDLLVWTLLGHFLLLVGHAVL